METPARSTSAAERLGPAIVLALAGAKLLFHLLTANRYGIFRDELYFTSPARSTSIGVMSTNRRSSRS